jgi:hypothetical protein
MFLTNSELIELTGFKHPSKQIEMLRRQGIAFNVNAAGHPKVVRAVLEGRDRSNAQPTKTWNPSWAVPRP